MKHPQVPQREQSNFLAPIAGITESAIVTTTVNMPRITNVATDGLSPVGIRQNKAAYAKIGPGSIGATHPIMPSTNNITASE